MSKTEKYIRFAAVKDVIPAFQAQTAKAEHTMKLYYVCTNSLCAHRWTE